MLFVHCSTIHWFVFVSELTNCILPIFHFANIVQVDQNVDEPWPLEVYGHDGTATNVTMEPGDMVLYESHSVIHGRPFPMRGNYFANCFIHYEPIEPLEGESLYNPALDIPPYLIPDSKWMFKWKQMYPEGWKKVSSFVRCFQLDKLLILTKLLFLS